MSKWYPLSDKLCRRHKLRVVYEILLSCDGAVLVTFTLWLLAISIGHILWLLALRLVGAPSHSRSHGPQRANWGDIFCTLCMRCRVRPFFLRGGVLRTPQFLLLALRLFGAPSQSRSHGPQRSNNSFWVSTLTSG